MTPGPTAWSNGERLGDIAQGPRARLSGTGIALTFVAVLSVVGLAVPALAEDFVGSSKADRIKGTMHADGIQGRGGGDRLLGLAGADFIRGNGGPDVILAGAGNDGGFEPRGILVYLYGGNGPDVIRGGGGRDAMTGDGGRDKLRGGQGGDLLDGGPGRDVLDGGPGRDECAADYIVRNCERVTTR